MTKAMKEEYDRLKDELGDDLVSKAALEAFNAGMSASAFVEKLRGMSGMREEYDRLNDEPGDLGVVLAQKSEQAMFEMIRKAAQMAAEAAIPLADIVEQLSDEYKQHMPDEMGRDGLN